jgi:aspartate/methionine/tyrosine aminotransferase
MNVALEAGDHVIVHSPCYQSLTEVARALGCEVSLWKADEASGWALDLDRLRKLLQPRTRVVVINSPHNPTGYLMPQEDFEDLIKLSNHHGFLIFSDEVYRFLEYEEGAGLPALCDRDERGVSLGVMSKSFGLAGLRIGWIATRNKELLRDLTVFKDYTTICNSAPSEFLAALALRNRIPIIARNRHIIRDNLGLLNTFFQKHDERFTWTQPEAGPIAFPLLKKGDVVSLCRDLAEKAGVLLLPGTVYDEGYNHFRIGFGRADFPACLEQLEAYLS